MGWRGIIIGSALALLIAALTLFNDTVMTQPLMTGNTMPTTVYGVLVILAALTGGHFLGLRWARRWLSPTDLVWIVVLATAACAWPGWSFYHPFTGLTGNVVNLNLTRPAWQAREVMSYVPGGSPRLAEGMLRDADELWRRLADRAPEAPDQWLRTQVRRQLLELDRWALDDAVAGRQGRLTRQQWTLLRRAVNQTIEMSDLRAAAPRDQAQRWPAPVVQGRGGEIASDVQRLNRRILADVWPEHVLPIPEGQGVILAGAQPKPGVTDTMLTGSAAADASWWRIVPWGDWWPVFRLWGGVAALIAVAAVCLSLIVHPQWSRSEQLPYPLVRLVTALVERGDGASLDPGRVPVFRNRFFWIALGSVLVLHLFNGLHAWEPGFFLWFPLNYNFRPLLAIWPSLGQVQGHGSVFWPTFFLSVVAFAFFVRTDVSFSVGISQIVWVLIGGVLLTWGIPLTNNQMQSHVGPLVRCGAYLGYAGLILYFGRAYYASLGLQALGLRPREAGHGPALWAARLIPLCVAASVWLLRAYTGLDWWLGLVLVVLALLMFAVLARITAETGLFYIQPNWLPITLIAPLLGFEGLGAVTFVLLLVASVVLLGDPRESIMAYLVNGLNMADRTGRIAPARAAWGQAIITLVAMGIAGAATLVLVYSRGIVVLNHWASEGLPALTFNRIAGEISLASSGGILNESVQVSGAARFTQAMPDWGSVVLIVLGVALVLTCALAALRLPRWPLHPVIFAVVGTTPMERLAWSFLIGWGIKVAAVRLGGEKAYVKGMPLMMGIIAGEVTAALGWQVAGVGYYLVTGLTPPRYAILPF